MKSIAILNLKGGVGKTVTAVNVATILATEHHKRVLLIDCDSQCNASQFFGVFTEGCLTLAELLESAPSAYPDDYIQETDVDGLRMIAASDGLMDLDVGKLKSGQASGVILRDLCQTLAEDDAYDFVFFDCPPAFNAASAAALMAADQVLIPVKLDAFSLAGMGNLLRQIHNMQKINPDLSIAGLLVTMWRPTRQNMDAFEALRNYLSGVRTYTTKIRRSDMADEMTFKREALHLFSPHASAAIDYRRFVKELLRQEAQL